MTYEEVMLELEQLGNEQAKGTLMKHGAKEPFFGVRIGDLKKLVKYVKKDQSLSEQLYASGNSDAMYLAGLSINPKLVSKELLQAWVQDAYWYMIAEYTVAGVAAESRYAKELAREWIESSEEMIASCGWSVWGGYVSITPDDELDMTELRALLDRVRNQIHSEQNRVRYTMNAFVMSVGISVSELEEEAKAMAEAIGKVYVDMGDTACKVPVASDYIEKAAAMGKSGKKRKTCIC